ncbi:MAG TPA: hypothetical protein VN962_22495 [Polyangia bacterium]|nr:hypothetical protein [Polyangia bacterium]
MRAWLAVAVLAALFGPAACSVKKVRFTPATDGGNGDAAGRDARPITDGAPRDAAPHDAPAADMATRDAATRDAAPRDAAAADATMRDATSADAAHHDAGPRDAAAADGGAGGHPGRDAGTDAHDAAATDALSTCGADLVPVMTGATTPSGAVLSSGALSSDYDPWHAFDGSNTSMWISPQGQDPTTIGYAWSDGPRLVRAYAITYANGTILTRAPSAWTFQGLLGDAWISLDSREGETGWAGFERRVYPIDTPGLYSEYRLSITDDNDATSGIVVVSMGNLELIGCAP